MPSFPFVHSTFAFLLPLFFDQLKAKEEAAAHVPLPRFTAYALRRDLPEFSDLRDFTDPMAALAFKILIDPTYFLRSTLPICARNRKAGGP